MGNWLKTTDNKKKNKKKDKKKMNEVNETENQDIKKELT